MDYRRHTAYSDPRAHAAALAEVPADLPALGAAIRNLVVHYRASGIEFPADRVAEIDNRWVDRILACDQRRFPGSLLTPRPVEQRVVGCCRDFTLLSVAALRQHGIPARSRVGFADYFDPAFHVDHVITEWWDGSRWRTADVEVDPAAGQPVDGLDVPLAPGGLVPASRVWRAYRRGDLDVDTYGVGGDDFLRGAWFVRNYVINELAHRYGDELLLWDTFGAQSIELDGDLTLIDEVAALLIAADEGDDAADRELEKRYRADPRLHPGPTVTSHSPSGPVREVTLAR
ncbi:transglutaminase-like domain-containing protein [Actinoplanes sp. N902-109]|uniref:transglutaminase-like domain-containing protein n=1 Tax=Actinoplanes sp. (strain N902-109) TaxID=649831 RepID=UPI0003294DF7|nr:transglutaminase-like domain-containing protein [Actinoplanes sp. N902-109]AGL20160.1 transglutaminase domain-containing protein [Actinoplanes sp. N902-109]